METYMTIEELAAYLKLAVQTIRRWVLNKEIPYHKVKKVIRFRVSEIERWIEGGGVFVPACDDGALEGELFADVEGGEAGSNSATAESETAEAGE